MVGLLVSWAAPVVALHLVSGADQRFSTWNHSPSSETVAWGEPPAAYLGTEASVAATRSLLTDAGVPPSQSGGREFESLGRPGYDCTRFRRDALDRPKRQDVANDLEHSQLTAVSAALKRSKTDHRPDTWKPPRRRASCLIELVATC